jgi:hypothetical protein
VHTQDIHRFFNHDAEHIHTITSWYDVDRGSCNLHACPGAITMQEIVFMSCLPTYAERFDKCLLPKIHRPTLVARRYIIDRAHGFSQGTVSRVNSLLNVVATATVF